MASTSGSEEASEDQWDDLAIVRAFEQALTDQQRTRNSSASAKPATGMKHKAASRSNGKKAARSVSLDEGDEEDEEIEQPAAPPATGSAGVGMYGQPNAAAYGGGYTATAGAFGYPQQQQQSSSDLYQAAYTQAYAQIQAQFQAAYPAAASQPYGPGARIPSFPTQSPYYPPPPPSSFPGMPGAPAPFPGSAPSATGSDDGLANVLMAWYQSGYFTGRFQAMQEMKMRGQR